VKYARAAPDRPVYAQTRKAGLTAARATSNRRFPTAGTKSDTAKQYLEKWLSLVAASRLSRAKPEEKELLLHWSDVVEYQ
jgi:hypothetical protein